MTERLKQFSVRVVPEVYETLRSKAFDRHVQPAALAAQLLRESLATLAEKTEEGWGETEVERKERIRKERVAKGGREGIELYDNDFDFSRLLPKHKR